MFVQGIHSKPEIILHNIQGFIIVPKQVKPKAPKSWLALGSSLQPYVTFFYQFIGCYVIDYNNNIDTWNIRKQVGGYIMFLKRNEDQSRRQKDMQRVVIIK